MILTSEEKSVPDKKPTKPKLLELVAQHSSNEQFHRAQSRLAGSISQFGLAEYHTRMADLHKATSATLYELRMFIASDLLCDPAIENEIGKAIRGLLKERDLLEMV